MICSLVCSRGGQGGGGGQMASGAERKPLRGTQAQDASVSWSV